MTYKPSTEALFTELDFTIKVLREAVDRKILDSSYNSWIDCIKESIEYSKSNYKAGIKYYD